MPSLLQVIINILRRMVLFREKPLLGTHKIASEGRRSCFNPVFCKTVLEYNPSPGEVLTS
jgi:hypothetical protein